MHQLTWGLSRFCILDEGVREFEVNSVIYKFSLGYFVPFQCIKTNSAVQWIALQVTQNMTPHIFTVWEPHAYNSCLYNFLGTIIWGNLTAEVIGEVDIFTFDKK